MFKTILFSIILCFYISCNDRSLVWFNVIELPWNIQFLIHNDMTGFKTWVFWVTTLLLITTSLYFVFILHLYTKKVPFCLCIVTKKWIVLFTNVRIIRSNMNLERTPMRIRNSVCIFIKQISFIINVTNY